jgi:hypothetical protein
MHPILGFPIGIPQAFVGDDVTLLSRNRTGDKKAQKTKKSEFQILLSCRVIHVDQWITAHHQAARPPRPFKAHLMPRHEQRIQHVAFLGVELAVSHYVEIVLTTMSLQL